MLHSFPGFRQLIPGIFDNVSVGARLVRFVTFRFFVPELVRVQVPKSQDFGYARREMEHILKGLILAQNERWRRGLGMQVERIPAA